MYKAVKFGKTMLLKEYQLVGIYHTSRLLTTSAKSYYDVLEVTPSASQAQIKAAYYRLSKKYHPDTSEEIDSKHKFARLADAYEVLGNRKNRSLYDRGLLNEHNIGSHRPSEPSEEPDLEYSKFIKKTGAFKKRHIYTGKTKIYDFDEYYKSHYGDDIRRSHEAKHNASRMEKERIQNAENQHTLIYFTFFVGILFALSRYFK